jgi:hypothetical protein
MNFPFINRKKICLIVNSNIGQSLVDAQWYAQQRGLDPSLVLSFDFLEWDGDPTHYGGTYLTLYDGISLRGPGGGPITIPGYSPSAPVCTTPGYTSYTYVEAIYQFVVNNGCEGLILSTYTPNSFGPAITLAQYASNAYYWLQIQQSGTYVYYTYIFRGRWVNTTQPFSKVETSKFLQCSYARDTGWYLQSQPDNYLTTTNSAKFNFYAKITSTWKQDNFPQIPHGRLGINQLNTTTGYQGYLTTSEMMNPLNMSQSIMYRCVSDAMAAEKVDHKNDLHLFSTEQQYVTTTPLDNAVGYYYALSKGINAKTINRTGGDYTVDQFQNSELPPWFGYAIAAGFSTGSPYGSQFEPYMVGKTSLAQGAYYYDWVSGNAQVHGAYALQAGCCSVLGQFQEPSANNCGASPSEIFRFLFDSGCSAMEANFLCNATVFTYAGNFQYVITSPNNILTDGYLSGWGTAFGDPLYSPYVSTVTSSEAIYTGTNAGVIYPDGVIQIA